MFKVRQHDILQGLPAVVQPNSVHLVYADTLYGSGNKFADYDDTSAETAMTVTRAIMEAAEKALVVGGALIIQCDQHANYKYRQMLESSTVFTFKTEIIWTYNSGGAGKSMIPHKHDTIFVATKGSAHRLFNVTREPYPHDYGDRAGFHPDGRMVTSVWNIPRLSNTAIARTGYSTEKPPALIERLIHIYTDEHDVVYDPVCGSGASGVAALSCNRNYIGTDVNKRAVDITLSRLADLVG